MDQILKMKFPERNDNHGKILPLIIVSNNDNYKIRETNIFDYDHAFSYNSLNRSRSYQNLNNR